MEDTSTLAKVNDFFYRKSFSLFDWMGMLIICNLGATFSWLWYLVLIPFIWVSNRLTNRFAPD